MNALVVGAGSVGQVFARYLHLAGNNVTFLIRKEHASSTSDGLVLYHLNKRETRTKPIRFSSFDVITQESQLGDRSWDHIYMCFPSNALSDPLLEWIQKVGGDATIIKLQPGLRDHISYASHFEDSQIVTGMLSLISYRAPLHGEELLETGTAYWFPPLMPMQFSGSEERVQDVVRVLKSGGMPVRTHSNVQTLVGYVLAVEAPLTAGLECEGWSINGFRRSRWFEVAYRAIHEASEVVSNYQQASRPIAMRIITKLTLQWAISLLPRLRTIPMEAYLKHHFTKLHSQSIQHLDDFIQAGMEYGISVASLSELKQGLSSSLSAV